MVFALNQSNPTRIGLKSQDKIIFIKGTNNYKNPTCLFLTYKSRGEDQFTYDYVMLKIGYFSNKIPVWEGSFTLENLIN